MTNMENTCSKVIDDHNMKCVENYEYLKVDNCTQPMCKSARGSTQSHTG